MSELSIPHIAITPETDAISSINFGENLTDVEDLEETPQAKPKSKLKIKLNDSALLTDVEDMEGSDLENDIKSVSLADLHIDSCNYDEVAGGSSNAFKNSQFRDSLAVFEHDDGLTDIENLATEDESDSEEIPDASVNLDDFNPDYVNISSHFKQTDSLMAPVIDLGDATDVESVPSDTETKVKIKRRKSKTCHKGKGSDTENSRRIKAGSRMKKSLSHPSGFGPSESDSETEPGNIIIPFYRKMSKDIEIVTDSESDFKHNSNEDTDNVSLTETEIEDFEGDWEENDVFEMRLPPAVRNVIVLSETKALVPTTSITPLDESSYLTLVEEDYGGGVTDTELFMSDDDFLTVEKDEIRPKTPDMGDYESSTTYYGENKLELSKERFEPLTDTEDLSIASPRRNKKLKKHLVVVDKNEAPLTDTEDFYIDNSQSKFLTINKSKAFSTPNLTDTEDLVASADETLNNDVMYLKGGSCYANEDMLDREEWDVSKKSAQEAPQDAEQQGFSTTTERLVASNEELEKPVGQFTGFSADDLKTVCEQTNAFIQSESQPEPYDSLAEKYTKKEPVNERKVDDNKNNMNEKKKAKKGFFGSIKTFVERSFESDSESEKSPKKTKKPKRDKKKKSKEEIEQLPPRKPKLPTPPLEPSDIDSIPFVESVSDTPPPYQPPEVPKEVPVTDLDEVTPKELVAQEEKPKLKEKSKEKEKKKRGKTIEVVEEVTKKIEPLVIEAEEFSIVVDPTKKESPKKSKETFTINIDESIEIKEKEIMEKSPILSEEKIVKPVVTFEFKKDIPCIKDDIYEDVIPVDTVVSEEIKETTTNLIQNEINFGGWVDPPTTSEKEKVQTEIVEKQDKEISKEKEDKKKEDKKGGFFGLFKKKDSKKDEDILEPIEKDEKRKLSDEVLKDIEDSKMFLSTEVENYQVDESVVVEEIDKTKQEVDESKPQTEGFFGFFKKPKKDDKDKKDPDKKVKKEEKKVAVILSEEVLRNILDSKRFLEGEVQNYHDVRPTVTKEQQIRAEATKVVDETLQKADEELAKRPAEETKKVEEEIAETSKKEGKRETSPKPSPGFFGLFKKSTKEEVETIIPEESVKDIKEIEEFITVEVEKPDEKQIVEEKKVEVVKETTEAGGFFGLFKKSKKDEEAAKIQFSETTIQEMSDTKQFISKEVENYEDGKVSEITETEKVTDSSEPSSGFFGLFKKTKKEDEKIAANETDKTATDVLIPEEEKLKKEAHEERESSPKPGFFGIFKKSKKDEEETATKALSDSVEVEVEEKKIVTNLTTEEIIKEEKLKTEKDAGRESSPKPGLFGLFKKSKTEDEEVAQIKTDLGKETADEETITKSEEKPLREAVDERETSPKPAFFGLFKKSKKDDEDITINKPLLSEPAVKEMVETKEFILKELEQHEDVKPVKFEPLLTKEVESSPKPQAKGLFGIFKKSKQDDEGDDQVAKEPENKEVFDRKTEKVDEESASPKPYRGLFGVFKKSKDDETKIKEPEMKLPEEVKKDASVDSSPKSKGLLGVVKKSKTEEETVDNVKIDLPQTVIKDMEDTKQFLKDEVTNYHDVKPERVEQKETDKLVESDVESSPKPARGIFGIFKKKRDSEDLPETKPLLSEEAVKEMVETEQFLTSEVQNYEDAKPESKDIDNVKEASRPVSGIFNIFKKSKKDETELALVEDEFLKKDLDQTPEVSKEETTEESKSEPQGFLSKFKITKKKPTSQLSEEIDKSVAVAQNLISTELTSDDVKVEIIEPREEKSVTFEDTKSKMVLEAHLPQPEVAKVVEVVKTEIAEIVEETKPAIKEELLQEASEVQQVVEKELKPKGKDKKGFFHRFGKKSKSQETSFEESRGRSEDESEESPKKQKRRKSSSPFKFFDKSKKSEEDVKEEEEIPETIPAVKEEDSKKDGKDDLLEVEFEQPAVMDLSEEVLSSLDKKMEELKCKYPPEVQKEINDCQDFLFVEKDNYDNAKPVVVTDIDIGLSSADKTIDNLVDKTVVIVEKGKTEIGIVTAATVAAVDDNKEKATQVVEAAVTKVEETTQAAAKKSKKKTGGFFSKMGSLISGSIDEAKSELKEAKKSVDKTKDSAEKNVKEAGKKSKGKVAETKEAAVSKIEKAEENVINGTTQKVEETKGELSILKDSLLDVITKTGENVSEIKQEVVEQLHETKDAGSKKIEESIVKSGEVKQDIVEQLQDAKDVTSKQIKNAKDIAEEVVNAKQSEMAQTAKGVETESQKKIAEAKEMVSEAKAKVNESIQNVVDARDELVAGTKEKISETKLKACETTQDVIKTLEDKKVNIIETGVTKLEETKEAVIEGGIKVTEDMKQAKEKILEDTRTTASRKIENIKEYKEEVEYATIKKAGDIKDTVQNKVEEVKQTSEKIVEDAGSAASQKIEDIKEYKEEVEYATIKKAGDIKDTVQSKVEEVKQAKEKVVEDANIAASQKIEELSHFKEEVEHTTIKKVDDISKTAVQKVEDVKVHLESNGEKVKQAKDKFVEDVQVSTSQKIDECLKTKDAVESAAIQTGKDAVKLTSQKVKDIESSIQSKADKVEETKEKLIENIQLTGSNKFEVLMKCKEQSEQVITQKAEDMSKVTSQKIQDLTKTKDSLLTDLDVIKESTTAKVEAVKEDVTKTIDSTKSATKNIVQAKDRLKQETEQKLEEVSKVTSDKIQGFQQEITPVKSDIEQQTSAKVNDLVDTTSIKAQQTKSAVTEAISQKIDPVMSALKQQTEALEESLSKKFADLKETKSTSEDTIVAQVHDIDKAVSQKVDDLSKLKECVIEDTANLKEIIKDTTESKAADAKKDVSQFAASIKESAESQKAEIFKATAQKIDSIDRTVEDKFQDLSQAKESAVKDALKAKQSVLDGLSGLANGTTKEEVLDQKQAGGFDEMVKSYVTSPTMARRAESQRFSKEERPTVREIKLPSGETDSDDEIYTVTEPEDSASKRKPLFHLESEEDDIMDLEKTRERRDSVKSNVLETLTETKLDNLLSDLETQMVKDLESAVTEGGKKVEVSVKQAETELEDIKKDSQADVEQIEQKLRDLDKALDSLEQASDSKLSETKLRRVERKFERMASEVGDRETTVSPERNEHEFQRLVSQLSTEEVSDFQKEYSHLWDETTFSKSDDWDSAKTPDSDVQDLPQETAAATLTEETKTVPQPKPRLVKEPLEFKQQAKLEKQISPVRDDLLDEEEMNAPAPETYSDKKKFWENVTKEKGMSLHEKRMSLHDIPTSQDKDLLRKRVSVHEVPIPKPRSQVSQSIDEVIKDSDEKVMSEYQASYQPPSKQISPPKQDSDTDSESDPLKSGTGYISDSGDVEHYISDSEIEDRVPQIRERQMSVFVAPPVAAARKTIYERSASLPTEDLYEVSARSIKLRKQYYEEQIKKEMIEEQLTSEVEEEPSPERKTLIGQIVQQSSEERISVRDLARSFDETTKKEVSFDEHPTHKPETSQTHTEDLTSISPQLSETHKEIDGDASTKRSSVGSEQSSSSDRMRDSTSKPDSMEVHVDKSEIEDSEKLAELDQDATDLETKSLDSLNAIEMSPKSANFVDDSIPEITVTLSGKQRRISEESDEYAPKKTELDSPINVPEERMEDTVWEVSVQSQSERFEEKVTSFEAAAPEKIDEDLSLSTRDESDMGSEIHQDHSDSYASDKIKSESQGDIERIILDSLHHQKVDPVEAKAIASALIEEIEAEIHRRECLPPSQTTGDVSDYLKYLAETKGLDEREVELVESVLARRQRELTKLSRADTQASSIEITDEDLRYSGAELDSSHILEQQISQLKAEKYDDIKINLLDKIDEKHTEESYSSKDFETYDDGVSTGIKSEQHTKSFDSIKGEKTEARDTIFEEDETISESLTSESKETTSRIEAVSTEAIHVKSDSKDVEEHRQTSVDIEKDIKIDAKSKTAEVESEDALKITTEDQKCQKDVTKSIIKHKTELDEKSPTDETKLKGEIISEDYSSKEETTQRKTSHEMTTDGSLKEELEESHQKTVDKAVVDVQMEEQHTTKDQDTTITQSKTSSTVISTDIVRESTSSKEVKEKIEVLDSVPTEISEVKITERHEEIKRTSSSESKSSIESGKSPEDQFSSCSSGRKGDSDSSKTIDRQDVPMRKASSLPRSTDRKSGLDFETYSSSGESHYHSFELDSGKSRPCSSDVEGLVAAGSSEYESALTSQDYSSRSHVTSTEYHTAVSSLSSKESMKSLDSESSGHLGSIEVSELSETLVPSTSDAEGDILDEVGWNEDTEDHNELQSRMKRSHEMTFQPEPKVLLADSPQTEDVDKKFTSMDDGSILSMSLSSTSNTTEPRTVIELSRADSERVSGGSMSASGISDQLSIEGSCDSLVFHPTHEMSTSTGAPEPNLQIESITFTTSMVNESGIRSVSTQVTSESCAPQEEGVKSEEPQPNGKCPPEVKKKCHRRQESTSFVPIFDQKFHSDLTESDKYTAELSLKEVICDEKKDVDEREKEESYETEADQGFHRDIREGKYQETEEEIKDDTPEFSSETQASVGELEQEYSSALARAQEVRKKSGELLKEQLEKRDSHGKSSSTSSEKSSFEEAEAEAAFNMVAHVSPAHKIKQICPILEDEDAEKHELETRERAQKEYEKRRAQIRDQSPGSIPDIKVTQHMTPLVDRNFHYPDLELEEQERLREEAKEKETPQTPSSKSSEDTDQGREYVLEDSGISIPETESKSTVVEQTVKDDRDKDTESPNSDSFEMLEKPDLIDDFVVIEEVAKEAQEFDSEGKSVRIDQKSGKRSKKHDEEVEAYLVRSAPTPLTKVDVKYYPDGSSSDELGFEFEDSPPVNAEAAAENYEKELEANKKWIEQQFQGDQAARLAAGYDYEMEFERGPLEDIKEEDINDFDPTSSRIGSLGKDSGGSLGSVKDSYSSTPDYDVLAGRKYFTRSGEHDDISMSSLQEFENLERAMSLENKRCHASSQDSSSNGSFKTRYFASKSGQGDDVSVSSLKEFEGLEMACIAAHKIETKAKEEEAMLAQIEEGQESLASESESCETVSHTDKKIIPDSDEEDYEKRMFEIDEIIRQAQNNVERFVDLKEAEKTESLGRGDSVEEVSKVPDLELDTPVVRSTIKVQWKESDSVMITSTDSIEAQVEKGSQHDSTDSLDQKTCADVMTASTDSIEFQTKKVETINLLSDSIEKDDVATGMIASDSLELASKPEMLESSDSLAEASSSAATHATYQYETDSVFSGSFTSGGSNTMVSSTDTIEPVQVDIGVAARKVWFDEEAASKGFSTEFIQDSSKPYVTEVIEPSQEEGFSHTVHRRVELPPEIRKVTFYGKDADEKLKQFIEDFNEGEHIEEVQEMDAAGNLHTRRVVQRRFIISGDAQTNQLTKESTGEESGLAAAGQQSATFKAQAKQRRQLRYEISVDDQIEVDPREHDWRFNLPEHGEEASGEQKSQTSSQQKVSDQHQLSEEMKMLLQELEKESKQ